MIQQSDYAVRRFVPFMVFFALLPAIGAAAEQTGASQAQQVFHGSRGRANQTAIVDFSRQPIADGSLSQRLAIRPRAVRLRRGPAGFPVPGTVRAGVPQPTSFGPSPGSGSSSDDPPFQPPGGPLSPPFSVNFQGLGDNGAAIPPDTMGAVGPAHVMTTLNTQINIQSRFGAAIAGWPKSLPTFWSSLVGSRFPFDPKLTYDPYNGRWIFVSVAGNTDANGNISGNSRIMIAVSQTTDPTGAWYFAAIDADPSNTVWADYPCLGFNKDWITVHVNMFNTGPGETWQGSRLYAFSKANLYAGTSATFTLFTPGSFFTAQPAVTYDNSLATEYFVQRWNGNSGGSGFIRIWSLSGPVGSETLAQGPLVSTPNPWSFSGNDAPQLGTSDLIDTGDDRIIKTVYRNGSLWATHTVFLPTGPNVLRASIQWWQITPAGVLQQRGRIDDPTGANYYAYPSIAVNANGDALIGYSHFSSSMYASGAYSFRASGDAANTLQSEVILKMGENTYFKTYGGPSNRWGDYSATVVDPIDDINLWTLQEYASSPANTFGVWWGKISLRTGTFTGTVLDRNRQPIANAEVHLFNLDTGQFAFHTVNTNVSGAYSLNLEEVPPGRYHIGAYKSGVNMWIFSPNFQGFTVPVSGSVGPTEIVLDAVSATKGAVQGFVRYDDVTGAHPIGLGVHIDVYDGGHLVASTDTDANGHYQINGLDCINIDGAHPWWGWHTYIATWTDANKVVRKAIGVNFGTWAGVPIRMDIPFKIP